MTSIIRSHCSNAVFSAGASLAMPALLTASVSGPSLFAVFSTAAVSADALLLDGRPPPPFGRVDLPPAMSIVCGRRELIRNQDRIDKPAVVIIDGVGIGRAIVQELAREIRHLLPGNSFDDQNVSSLKVRRFHNAMPAMYDGLVRLPTTMPGLETLLAEFAAFPDGRHDDQVDAVCNVAANRELVIKRARLYGERLGRIRPIAPIAPPPPPKSRDQELYDRRRQYRY